MGIVVIGATFVDIKGFPEDQYLPTGRNVGRVEYIHGGVSIPYNAAWVNSARASALPDDDKEVLAPYRIQGVF